jgi:diacylglycerol kinase family enzyme
MAVAAKTVVEGRVSWMDVNLVTTYNECIASINELSVGLIGDVGIVAEAFRCLGPARYDVMALWGLLKGFGQKISLDILDKKGSRVQMKDSYTTVFVNSTQHFGKGMRAAPSAKLDDGLMDLVCTKAGVATRGDMLAVFQQVPSGAHEQNEFIDFQQVREVTLNFGQPGVFNVDGEIAKHDGTIKMSVLPKAIKVFANRSAIAGNMV